MYQGFSRENGSIIGRVGSNQLLELQEAQDTIGAEETLICIDESNQEVNFSSCLDPTTGEIAWLPCHDSNFIKTRTLAMGHMTSMLRDSHRNRVYEAAIEIAMRSYERFHERSPVVMDIGTGTGLLSIFAAKYGSQLTYAVEMFDLLAATAKEIVDNHGLSDKIMVIPGKSCDIEELPVPVDIIVSELLDSALLGESVLPSHMDAIHRLMRKEEISVDGKVYPLENRVIPNRAELYATLIESLEVASMVSISEIAKGREPLDVFRNEEARQCPGGWPQIPMRWEALEYRGAKKLSNAIPCLYVQFWRSTVMESGTGFLVYDSDIVVSQAGIIHGVLLWWKTFLLSSELDPSESIYYSTEPGAHPWQDHWQQTVFPLPQPIAAAVGDIIRLKVCHDDIGIWLTAEKVFSADISASSSIGGKRNRKEEAVHSLSCMVPRPPVESLYRSSCSCGWHLLCGPDRLQCLNQTTYKAAWNIAIEHIVAKIAAGHFPSTNYLDLSDGSMLSMTLAAKLKGHAHGVNANVITREKKQFSQLFYAQLINQNQLNDVMCIWDGAELPTLTDYLLQEEDGAEGAATPVSVLISDCFYYQLHSLPIWQALSFHFQRTALSAVLAPQCMIVPCLGMLMALPLELPELRLCHGLAGSISGIDQSPLDNRQQSWYQFLYPYRLGNYNKRALSTPVSLAAMDFRQPFGSSIDFIVDIVIHTPGRCDGVALWIDYCLDSEENRLCHWNGSDFPPYLTQSVKLFKDPRNVQSGNTLRIMGSFQPGNADFEYSFSFIDI